MTKIIDRITVVLHGPVQANPDRSMEAGVTQKAIQSIRNNLPDAHIILSTWEGQPVEGLDIDELVLNKDPGPNIIGYDFDGRALKENNNRQIVAVREGLKRVATKYAIKLRSDNFLLHSGFIGWQKAYPLRHSELQLFTERVVVSHRLTKLYSNDYPIVRHLCDFFAYGLTEDLLKMWDLPLFDDFPFNDSQLGQGQHMSAPRRIVSAEQHFVSRWITKLNPSSVYLKSHFDYDKELDFEWKLIMANNLVIVEANNLGLRTVDRLKSHRYRANEISHAEWQSLYRDFCDPSFLAPKWQLRLDKTWYRKLKSPIGRLKLRLKRNKDALGM